MTGIKILFFVPLFILFQINLWAEVSPEISAALINSSSANELHMIPDSGRSGYPITISYTINNTEQFVAFQFDIILPSVLTYVPDSVWLFRKTDHIIIANQINQQTLRIVAFSPTNQPFLGNDGEIVAVKYNLNGTNGAYNVGLTNVTISNAYGANILTGYFPGYIKIIAPDIDGLTNINFGEVSVLDTLSYEYEIKNTGNDTLIMTDIFSSEIYFWNDTPLPQSIPPFSNKIFIFRFHNLNKGDYSTTFTINNNDPDENPFSIDASASSFAPNYILIQNTETYVGNVVTLKIDVNNYEEFIDFQVDLNFPSELTYISNSAVLTSRKQDHLLFDNMIAPDKIRLFTYSQNQLPFLGDSGTVVTLNFIAGIDTGTFPLHLSGGILFNSTMQNIIRGTIDGVIHIIPIPTFQLSVNIGNGWNVVSIPGNHPDGNTWSNWWPFKDPASNIYRYHFGYQIADTLYPGEGYWMKHIGARTYNTEDEWPAGGIQIVPHNPIAGEAGWNLFGGYENVVTASLVTTNPPGLHSGPIYRYSGGYQTATSLVPGYGYWITLTAAGQIIIPESFAKESNPVKYFPENWGRIEITDAAGVSYTLYAVNGEVNLDAYELPPAPMEGMYDFRFSSGRIAEDINSGVQTIEMKGVEYPLTVRVEGMDLRLMDESGKIVNVNLKSGENIEISDASIQKLMVSGTQLPEKYSLEQNYPNPFNPSTMIEFSLPEDVTNAKLSIYNALGEKVAELVNASLVAGKYKYQWNASVNRRIATGMYIYELRTDKFVSVKKMILLK